jgi:hypothetical protein
VIYEVDLRTFLILPFRCLEPLAASITDEFENNGGKKKRLLEKIDNQQRVIAASNVGAMLLGIRR